MSEKLDLVRAHAEGEHPLLDFENCPICEWMQAQHKQAEIPA